MKRFFWALTSGFLLVSPALAAFDPFSVYAPEPDKTCFSRSLEQELSLPDLIEIAVCNNPALNREYMSVRESEASLGVSKADYLPAVTLNGSLGDTYTHTESLKSAQDNPYEGNVALSWLLYDFGGRSARTEQMRAYLEAARFDYNALLNDTVLAVTEAYFDALSSQEVLKSTKTAEESYQKSFEESSRRYELGLVSLSDKLLAETSYEQSKLAVAQADNDVKKNMGALAVLLNLSPDTVFSLTRPPKDKDISRLDTDMGVEEMMRTALGLRPEVKSRLAALEALKQEVKAASSAHWPTISATAGATFNDNWRTHSLYNYNTRAALQLSVPIFSGFSTSYSVAKARYAEEGGAFALQEVKDRVTQEVWDAYQNYRTAVSSYDIAKKVLASAKENERVAFASYQVGTGSILNLLTATSQLAQARQEQITAFYAVLTSKSNLYRAIGRF